MVSKTQILLVICLAHTGYRRAGVAFDKGENRFQVDAFSQAQLAALNADPRLKVSVVDVAPTSGSVDVSNGNSSLSFSDAITQLDKENPDHFTAGGKPQCTALEALMGRAISAGERDALWATQLANEQGE